MLAQKCTLSFRGVRSIPVSSLVSADLDKIMQRFLRQPFQGVTLSTLVRVYRAVMRLSAIADAMDDSIEPAGEDGNKAESGPVLLRRRIISPLQQVSYTLLSILFPYSARAVPNPSQQPFWFEGRCCRS